MSLINRMLDQLAARQAPGAEALGGVQLNEPLEEARNALTVRSAALVIVIAAAIALLAWMLWLRSAKVPVPVPRAAVQPPADTIVDVAPTAAGPPAVAAGVAPSGLRLEMRLHQPPAGFSARLAGEPQGRREGSVREAAQPQQRTPARRAEAPARTAPQLRTADALDHDTARSAPAAGAGTRKQAAREHLAGGAPAAALEALGSRPDPDDESVALRAAALQRLGRHAEAADLYRGLAATAPTQPAHWVGLAISLESLAQRDAARGAYQRALGSPLLASSLRAFAQARFEALGQP